MKAAVLIFFALVSVVLSGRISYAGSKVVRIYNAEPILYDTLNGLKFDVWSHGPHPELDVRVTPEQENILVTMGLVYDVIIPDVQALIDAEEIAMAKNADNADFFLAYHKYDEVLAYYKDLATTHSDIVTLIPSVGKSLEGRDLFGVKITTNKNKNADKPIIWYNGGQHAREWVSISTVAWITTELLDQYGKTANVTEIMDHFTFYIFPIINPDGYEYTWSRDRLWRKNRRNNGGSYGVDLNRNWDNHWGGPGSSPIPSSDTYHGKNAFSEPETKAISDFIKTLKGVKMGIDFHSYSQLILRPYGWTHNLPKDETIMKTIGDGMANSIRSLTRYNYVSEHSIDLYITAGTALDWFYEPQGFYGYTIELRDTGQYGFVLPPAQIKPCGQENFAAIVWAATYLLTH